MMRDRLTLGEDRFVEIVIWQTPHPVRGSHHSFKYRLVLIVREICILRYDNEAGKGDHKHLGELEVPYEFVSLDRLVSDFWTDVARLKEAAR